MIEIFRPGSLIANDRRRIAGIVIQSTTDGYYIRDQFGDLEYIPFYLSQFWHNAGQRSMEIFNYVWRTFRRFPFYIWHDGKNIYFRDRENGYWRYMEMPAEEVIPLEM